MDNVVHGLVIGVPLILLYLLPALVAGGRGHRNQNSIAVINLFLGWTLIGWVVALAWACSANVAARASEADRWT